MTHRERNIIKQAIKELMADEGDFHGAMEMLTGLVGIRYYPAEVLRKAAPVPVTEVMKRPNSEFSVTVPKRKAKPECGREK